MRPRDAPEYRRCQRCFHPVHHKPGCQTTPNGPDTDTHKNKKLLRYQNTLEHIVRFGACLDKRLPEDVRFNMDKVDAGLVKARCERLVELKVLRYSGLPGYDPKASSRSGPLDDVAWP